MAKMCNQGLHVALEILFGAAVRPTFYLGLYTAPTTEPLATASLGTLTEPSAGGYARVELVDADWTATGNVITNILKTIAASGGAFGNCYGYFITDCLSGTAGLLYAVEHFAAAYNIADGGSMQITPAITGS